MSGISKLILKNGKLTQEGIDANKKAYDTMNSLGLVVRGCNIFYNEEGKRQFLYPISKYKDDKGNYIKFTSRFDISNNCLYIFTGELHGGYIGIDIDVKGEVGESSYSTYEDILIGEDNEKDQKRDTLTCRTPSGGYHYVYKLNEEQREALKEYKTTQPKLFDCDIDVIYNAGKFVMSGYFIDKDGEPRRYKVVDWSEPSILPGRVFDEIMKRKSSQKLSVTIPPKIQQKKEDIKISPGKEEIDEDDSEQEEIDEKLKQYMDCFDVKRCTEYSTWFTAATIIKNEGGSFKLFDEWSKLCEKKYSLGECKKLWDGLVIKIEGKKNTIATFIKWAQEDNMEKFLKIRHSWTEKKEIILASLYNDGPTDDKMAKLYHLLYKDRYRFDEINECWYIINKFNIWKKDKKGRKVIYDITKKLKTTIKYEYEEQKHDLEIVLSEMKPKGKETDGEMEEKKEKMRKKLKNQYKNLIRYLEMNSHCKNVLEKLAGTYKGERIFEKFNEVNHYIFAFNNGVYDLKENKFRLPDPEELVSMTCCYNYEEINKDIQKAMDDINKVITSMFSDEIDRDIILTELALCLNAVPAREEFYVWKGKGRNGKGVLDDLLSKAFGDYYMSIDVGYFNQTKHGRHPSSSDEVIAQAKSKRIMMANEPESDVKLRPGLIQKFTGNGKIDCRHNFGSQFTFNVRFRLFFQTNYDLNIDKTNTTAQSERINIRGFPYSFVSKPTTEDERKVDRTLKERMSSPEYKIAFFHILLSYYKKWEENGRKIPKSENFKSQTELYLASNDPVTPFYNKMIEDAIITPINDPKQYVRISELFKLFNVFYQGENKNMTNKEFQAAIANKGPKVVLLKGYTVIRNIKFDEAKAKEFTTGRKEDGNIEFIEDDD